MAGQYVAMSEKAETLKVIVTCSNVFVLRNPRFKQEGNFKSLEEIRQQEDNLSSSSDLPLGIKLSFSTSIKVKFF
mgnify:CR=1 FL=1